MKIDRITVTHVQIPLREPFRISSGSVSAKDGIIVAVASDGVIGYGEASPMSGSFYSTDTPESTWSVLEGEYIPRVLRAGISSIEQLNAILDEVPENSFAKAGLETAFWDLEAQKKGEPLHTFMGHSQRPVVSGLAVGIYPTIKDLLIAVETYLAEGYKRLKIKIEPGWDTEVLGEIRKRFNDIPLMVDANCAYTRKDIPELRALDEFDLMMIEQPFPKEDLAGHQLLQASMRTPICLDESAIDADTVAKAIATKSCKIINMKIQRVGGLLKAKQIREVCDRANIPVWAGTMPELGIGSAQTLHMATHTSFRYPSDVHSSRRWFVDDIIEPLIEVVDGLIHIPVGAGNCYNVNQSVMKRYRLREMVF